MGLLDGKVAIVTGAGHGIGRGEALELARQGAKVVVNDVGGSVHGEGEDKLPAEEVAEIIRSRGGEATPNDDDVADWAGASALVRQAVDEFGRLDILVNNAGIVRDGMIFSMTEDAFDAVVRVHLKGTFATTHHASVYWREESKAGRQPRAAIVNTVSSAGLQGNVGQANYGAAKAGIAALTVISSLELSRYGVRANAVAPGGMTRITATLRKDAEVPRARSARRGRVRPHEPGQLGPHGGLVGLRRRAARDGPGLPGRRAPHHALRPVVARSHDRAQGQAGALGARGHRPGRERPRLPVAGPGPADGRLTGRQRSAGRATLIICGAKRGRRWRACGATRASGCW